MGWVVAIECFAWLTFNTAKFNTRFKAKGGGRCSRLGVGIRLEEIYFGILGVAVLNVAVLIGNLFAYAPRTRILVIENSI